MSFYSPLLLVNFLNFDSKKQLDYWKTFRIMLILAYESKSFCFIISYEFITKFCWDNTVVVSNDSNCFCTTSSTSCPHPHCLHCVFQALSPPSSCAWCSAAWKPTPDLLTPTCPSDLNGQRGMRAGRSRVLMGSLCFSLQASGVLLNWLAKA